MDELEGRHLVEKHNDAPAGLVQHEDVASCVVKTTS